MTEEENPCLPWTKVQKKVKKYDQDKWELGNHNYCRNPGEDKHREYCYISLKKWEYCATKTCSKGSHQKNVKKLYTLCEL